MKKLGRFLAAIVFILTACNTATPAPTSTPLPTSTPPPTATITSSPIPLVNVEGVLFFDYNGSGLREDEEPALPNFEVCIKAKAICVKTDENGKYEFKNIAPEGTTFSLSIVDPNVNNPALAFRYINYWKGKVTIPAYEKNGIQVPEQNLDDTVVIPVDRGVTVITGAKNEVGLMQGFLTSPFLCGQSSPIGLWYDHDTRGGYSLNYAGEKNPLVAQEGGQTRLVGGWDNHDGTDFAVPIGTTIIASAPGIVNWADYIPNERRPLAITIDHFTNREFATGSGHHSVLLVERDDPIYRGQIIALSGKSGSSWPHVHFDVFHPHREINGRVPTIDPFGTLFETDDTQSKLSQWSVFNTIICAIGRN